MSFGFRRRRAEAGNAQSPQPSTANKPDTNETPLRDVLRKQLLTLAEQGNVTAIKELLDRPNLLDERPVPMTYEACRAELARMIGEVMKRAGVETADELLFGSRPALKPPELVLSPKEGFEKAVENRLRIEESSELALKAWQRMSPEDRAELWQEIHMGLRSVTEDKTNVETLVQ